MRPVVCVVVVAALVAGCGDGHKQTGAPIKTGAVKAAKRSDYTRPFGAAVEDEFATGDSTYRRLLISHFTSITPENALKWALVEPKPGKFDFSEMDALAAFAQKTGKRLRGHPLVWDQQLPDWVAGGDWTRAKLTAVLRRHIRTIVSRYRGKVAE